MNANQVTSRSDFSRFLGELSNSARSEPSDFENSDLGPFLEAAQAWVDDMDGYFEGIGEETPDPPTWRLFASILAAATIYE